MATNLRLISSITPQDGFHPISTTYIIFTLLSSSYFSNCTCYLYFTLPPLIFIDPYELAHHAQFYTFKHWGTANLELPVHAVSQNDSGLLLNLTVLPKHVLWTWDNSDPEAKETDVGLEIKVPLHLRYGDSGSAGYHTTEMDWPTGFIACPQDVPDFRESLSCHSPYRFSYCTLFKHKANRWQ
jgi:PIG-X / PBN1